MFASLPLVGNGVIFAAAAMIVWFAGRRLARYADAIAERTGIGQAAIGVVLLGGVTSLPELAVAVTATLNGNPGLSVNDVLGSAAINVLILALADFAFGRGALTSTLASASVVLQGLLSVLLLAIVAAAVTAGDVEVFGMGIGSWVMLIVYAIALRLIVQAKSGTGWVPVHAPPPVDPRARNSERSSSQGLVVGTLSAGSVILVAGWLLAQTGAVLAEQTGLGTHFFGAVLLALATSLPEVSTVVEAVRLKRYEMAIADVFGTNLFNVMIIVLVDLLHAGKPVLVEVGAFAAFGALLASLLTVLFLVGMIERNDRTILRMGLDSIAAIACYVGGLFVLYQLR